MWKTLGSTFTLARIQFGIMDLCIYPCLYMYWAVLSHFTISNARSDKLLVLESAVHSISHHTCAWQPTMQRTICAWQPTMQRTISAWQRRNLRSKHFKNFLFCLPHSYSIPISHKTCAPQQYCLNHMTQLFRNMRSTLTAQPCHFKGNSRLGLTPGVKMCDVVE